MHSQSASLWNKLLEKFKESLKFLKLVSDFKDKTKINICICPFLSTCLFLNLICESQPIIFLWTI